MKAYMWLLEKRRWRHVVLVAITVFLCSDLSATRQQENAASGAGTNERALLDKYCIGCHSQRLKSGGLVLEAMDLTDLNGNAEKLEKVVRKLRLGAMPPQGSPRPAPAVSAALIDSLERSLDRAAAARPRPGAGDPLHRLNRTEYQNAIRDLVGIEGLDVAGMLPVDDASYGFDNVAGVLGISPTHLERYLAAARQISRIAVGDVTIPPTGETHTLPAELSQDDRFDDLPFGTRGGTHIRRYFPVDGEYIIRFQSVPGVGTALAEANRLELTVDGESVFSEIIEQKRAPRGTADDFLGTSNHELRVPIKGGLHDIDVTFVKTTFAELEDFLQPFLQPPGVSIFAHGRTGGYAGPYIASVSFLGPFNATAMGPDATPSRRRIFTCYPAKAAEELPCARKILSTLAQRAYRRPINDPEVEELLGRLVVFYKEGHASAGFERGIRIGLERLLASPGFLFRTYRTPAKVVPGQAYRLDDVELASRLSSFLWSSIPDEELLEVAGRGKLRDPAVLERQVRRMLTDPRSEALVNNFAGQWLRLRNVQGVNPDNRQYPDFDDSLRQAARRETELFFDSIMREDRSVTELLSANYTFLNERLARHYGIPNIYGSHFRRVTLDDPRRGGLLGHASILMVTSQANRTSPVVRGKFILENLLGAPPPSPPADVPPLEDTQLQGTMRQRMEQHRKNPVCASCHKAMDPLGFALENFDAVGAWRIRDGGVPVDSDGTMPDGTSFKGMPGLKAALVNKPDVFVTTFTEKLLTYALGRGIEYYDAPAIRSIVRTAAQSNHRFSSIVLGLIKSVPFQMRQSEMPDTLQQIAQVGR